MNGHRVVAATIAVTFAAMLKVQTETILVSSIDRIERRKVFTRARLTAPSGEVVTEAEGLFIIMKEETLRALDR
jgi:hypothetical protein